MGIVNTKLTLCRYDKDHRLLDVREQPSRSWLRHFFELWYMLLGFNSNTLAAINDFTATPRNLIINPAKTASLIIASMPGGAWNGIPMGQMSTVDVTQWMSGEQVGIVVGSNNAVVVPTNDCLNTRILHGVGAGTLLYGGTSVHPPTVAGPNGEMVFHRYLTNKSGGDVTIREVGIHSPGHVAFAPWEDRIFCICRDVVAPDVVVHDTQILEVDYTVGITV